MTMNRLRLLAGISVLVLAGCGGKRVNTEEVRKVQRVAIVGYRAFDNVERGEGGGSVLGTVNAIRGATSISDGSFEARAREQGEQIYEIVREGVAGATSWKIATREEIAANPVYAALHRERMGLASAGIMTRYLRDADGILWELHPEQLEPAQRDELIAALGVDAVATAHVVFETGKHSGVSVTGVGSRTYHPRATLTFKLFTKGVEKPILISRSTGVATAEGMKTVMGVDTIAEQTRLFLEASRHALEAFASDYREMTAN